MSDIVTIEHITPSYYKMHVEKGVIDVFDIARYFKLSNCEFSALKYIIRRKESRVKDLKKAIECLEREIEFIEKEKV